MSFLSNHCLNGFTPTLEITKAMAEPHGILCLLSLSGGDGSGDVSMCSMEQASVATG